MPERSVRLPEDSEIPEDLLTVLRSYPPLNITRLLTLVPECFEPWMAFVRGVYRMEVDAKVREALICRHAFVTQTRYESFQHSAMAMKVGLTDEELNAITSYNTVDLPDQDINLVCTVVDELEGPARSLSDDTFDRLFDRFGQKGGMQIIVTLGHYACVCRVVKASRITTEEISPLVEGKSPGEL